MISKKNYLDLFESLPKGEQNDYIKAIVNQHLSAYNIVLSLDIPKVIGCNAFLEEHPEIHQKYIDEWTETFEIESEASQYISKDLFLKSNFNL